MPIKVAVREFGECWNEVEHKCRMEKCPHCGMKADHSTITIQGSATNPQYASCKYCARGLWIWR